MNYKHKFNGVQKNAAAIVVHEVITECLAKHKMLTYCILASLRGFHKIKKTSTI